MKYLGTITDPKDLTTKKYVDDSVSGVQTSLNTLSGRVDTNEDNIAMAESDIEGLQGDVGTLKTNMTAAQTAITTLQDTYVPNTTKVNGKALSADVTLTAGDIGAVPTTRTVNNKALSADISLTASDVGALPTTGGTLTGDLKVGSASIGKNGYVVGTWLQATAANHLTTAATKIAVQDINGWIYHRTASEILSDIGAVPTSRTINGKALTTDITLTSTDLGMGDTSNIIYGEDAVNVEATTPINADTLESHPASYFATASSVTDLTNSVTNLASGIRAIYIGTTDPASSLGANGDIYIKYNG